MNKNHRHTGGAIEANIKHHTIRYAQRLWDTFSRMVGCVEMRQPHKALSLSRHSSINFLWQSHSYYTTPCETKERLQAAHCVHMPHSDTFFPVGIQTQKQVHTASIKQFNNGNNNSSSNEHTYTVHSEHIQLAVHLETKKKRLQAFCFSHTKICWYIVTIILQILNEYLYLCSY